MSTEGIYIPPILRDVQFIGVEEHNNGLRSFVFASNNPIVVGGVVRVNVFAQGPWMYSYTIVDPETKTFSHYKGVYGDIERDKCTTVKAMES